MQLIRAIYASYKIDSLTREDIESILAASRANNSRAEITGLLCFSHHHFLQCLEGSREQVNQLYNKITRDSRHAEPFIIDYSEISERAFSSWAMGYVPDTAISRELILKYSTSGQFDPTQMSAASALGFLRALTNTIE
ncbi:MAG: BLUF domain-containing protein [Oceanospirillaceae bacterium]|nr:BLUF domain-containing protein [Oceanospirillaceae bacterium]